MQEKEKSSTNELPTRFAVEFFFVLRVAQVKKAKDFFFRRATYKGMYVEAVESAKVVCRHKKGTWERRRGKDQGRQEGGSRKGKVPCALNQEFLFLVHKYLGLEAACLVWSIGSYET